MSEQALRKAVAEKRVVLHATDFQCMQCLRSFDFATVKKKVSPLSFVLAHLKSCRFAAGSRSPSGASTS